MNEHSNDSLHGFSEPLAKAIAFVWREAELLDRKNYSEWSALWLEQGHYVVPIDPNATDFAAQLNYAYDDAHMRSLRIERLSSGHSMSAADAAGTVRTVSRFTLVRADEDMLEVNSAQVLVSYKRQVHTLFAANLTHQIRFIDGVPKLQLKVVRLVNSMDSINALGFLL